MTCVTDIYRKCCNIVYSYMYTSGHEHIVKKCFVDCVLEQFAKNEELRLKEEEKKRQEEEEKRKQEQLKEEAIKGQRMVQN